MGLSPNGRSGADAGLGSRGSALIATGTRRPRACHHRAIRGVTPSSDTTVGEWAREGRGGGCRRSAVWGRTRRRPWSVIAASTAEGDGVLDTMDDDSDQNSGRPKRSAAAFLGAFLLNVLLGTLYCWSCYLVPLEQALGVGRGLLSGVFSLATICFTVAVAKLGPWLYAVAAPAVIGTGAAVCAGAGLLIASQSIAYVSAAPLFLGYGVVFGAASGVGYGLSVQMASRAPFGEGLSTGLITSARAAGAFVFAPVVRYLLDGGGAGRAMSTMGCALLASAPFIYGVLATDGTKHPLASQKRDKDLPMTTEEEERERQLGPAMFALWISLGLGVSAGLMLMAHASALLYSHGASIGVATAGVSIVSVFTTAGRIFGGWACDRSGVGAERVLRWAPFVAVPALAGAAVAANSVAAAQAALAAASIVYGVFASVIPVEVRRRTGSRDFARQFGKVYTAWGFAGLAAPVAAGCLFEARGDYTAALVAATALCILSAMVVRWMLKPGRSHEEWKEAIAEAKRAKAEEDAANGISQVIAP